MAGCDRSEFDVLLDRYESNEPNATRRLRQFRDSAESEAFLGQVRATLLQRPATAALKFATTLVGFEELLKVLLELYLESKEEAIALVKKLLECDPRFDTALLDGLRDSRMAERSEDAVMIVLDILDEISEGDKLVLSVTRLLRHPNPKLRSKAAAFIARRRPHLPWVSDLSNEPDPRVRANIVESVEQIGGEIAFFLLRKHVADENSRVSGNALLGLYRLGDTAAIRQIDEMSRDPRPSFRLTSAWVMGETADARFAANLAAQLSDPDPLIRRRALKSLGQVKEGLKQVNQANGLRVAVVKYGVNDSGHSLAVAVRNDAGEAVRDIPGTKFVLKSGGKYIRKYEVKEQELDAAIQVAYVLCLPVNEDEQLLAEYEKAMEACGAARRPKDGATVSKLTHEAQTCCVQEDATQAVAALRDALVDVAFALPNLNVVMIGASIETSALDAMIHATADLSTTIHVLALSPEWRSAEIRGKVNGGAGFFFPVQQATALTQACSEHYSALQHHYRLTWEESAGGEVDLEVRCESGTGSASYQMDKL